MGRCPTEPGSIQSIAAGEFAVSNDLDTDRMLSLALVRLVEIIGEAGNRVSETCQAKYSKIPWRQIVGMRNRIIE